MSTLKVDNIRHNSATSDAITMASDGTCTAKLTSINGGSGLSHRNKAFNGAMMISQRGTSFDIDTTSTYTLDRFTVVHSGGITYEVTATQDSSAPDGFRKSLKLSPDTVETSMSGSENGMIIQNLEGQDLQDFAFGTSSAKKLTISFYAKSGSQNNNHQYTLQIRKYDDSNNRNMVNRAFTVTTSWQRYTMTFDGDTAENIRNDNGLGMQLVWHLATGPSDIHGASTTFGRTVNNSLYSGVTGQSNFLDNTNNEFYLTGVQLEVGDTATSFEHRSHGDELLRCHRYYYRETIDNNDFFTGMGMADIDGNSVILNIPFPVVMRGTPNLDITGNATDYMIRRSTTLQCTAVPSIGGASTPRQGVIVFTRSSHGWGDGSAVRCGAWGTSYLGFSAEL